MQMSTPTEERVRSAGDVEIKRDMERGRDEVRVMTVHGAKGLQAPIVILPDTTQQVSEIRRLLWRRQDDLCVWVPVKRQDGEVTGLARAEADVSMSEARLAQAKRHAAHHAHVRGHVLADPFGQLHFLVRAFELNFRHRELDG